MLRTLCCCTLLLRCRLLCGRLLLHYGVLFAVCYCAVFTLRRGTLVCAAARIVRLRAACGFEMCGLRLRAVRLRGVRLRDVWLRSVRLRGVRLRGVRSVCCCARCAGRAVLLRGVCCFARCGAART